MQNAELNKKKLFNFQFSIFNSQFGQTLIEAIAAIAVAVVIVTALVTLAISTQRAANTSRNQNQNTLYGQDTIELIRSIRDSNKVGGLNMGTLFSCVANCKFSDLYSLTYISNPSALASPGLYFTLTNSPVGCGGGGCWVLTKDTNVSPTPVQISSTIYSRKIRIWDNGRPFSALDDPLVSPDPTDKVKFVEVTITWIDSAGTHSSVTSTKLTNFK